MLVFGLCAILGHSFSIFIGFKGGKAVATSAGILLAYNWQFFLIAITIFAVLLFITSMVSLTSIIAMILVFLLSFATHDWILTLVAFGVSLFVIVKHRANITRIKNGTESLVPFGLYRSYLNRKNKD